MMRAMRMTGAGGCGVYLPVTTLIQMFFDEGDTRMRVAAALLANNAVVDGNGLLHVEGGGWDRYSADSFPSTLNGAVCGVLELSQADVGVYRALRISVTDTGGQADASRWIDDRLDERPRRTAGRCCTCFVRGAFCVRRIRSRPRVGTAARSGQQRTYRRSLRSTT